MLTWQRFDLGGPARRLRGMQRNYPGHSVVVIAASGQY